MDRRESILAAKQVSTALGMPWLLPANAFVKTFNITSNTVSVTLDVFKVEETTRESRFVGRGTRMLVWELDDTFANGWKYTCMTLWDDNFEPVAVNKIGRIESPAEYHARRDWEAMQYRVGNDKSPMDNAARTAEGLTTDAMTNHWNRA